MSALSAINYNLHSLWKLVNALTRPILFCLTNQKAQPLIWYSGLQDVLPKPGL